MQDKMKCDQNIKARGNPLVMIQKHSTSKFAIRIILFSTPRNQNARNEFKIKEVRNTDINNLNGRFNLIFLVIPNRDFYCMLPPADDMETTYSKAVTSVEETSLDSLRKKSKQKSSPSAFIVS